MSKTQEELNQLKTEYESLNSKLQEIDPNYRNKGLAKFLFDETEWKELLASASGKDIHVKVYEKENGIWAVYKTFAIHVAADNIDSHLAYRLIPPGYEPWYHMGIYQRNLTSYEEKAIIENSQTDHNCMNCHSFPMQNPDKMVFHMRGPNGGTYIIDRDKVEKLNTKTPQTISALVYPQWHPDGRYIAFSVNDISQVFHSTDRNRIEVYDSMSDVVIYDVERHEVMSSPLLMSEDRFETYPSFSPDGRTMYFCKTDARGVQECTVQHMLDRLRPRDSHPGCKGRHPLQPRQRSVPESIP